jgi:hypothetical protein
MNCTQTAAHLTERYHTFQPFDPEELSLNRYLSRNGLLLSMCLNIQSWRPCAPTGDQNHLAASWIQSQETGYRVIHAPQLPDTTFGIILDPEVTEINCLYPVDAGSDGRDRKGCGPPTYDPTFGSLGSSRVLQIAERYQLTKYKNEAFGKDTPWTDIDCGEFLDTGPWDNRDNITIVTTRRDGICDLIVDGRVPLAYKSISATNVEYMNDILRHPVCTMSDDTARPSLTVANWLVYLGECYWEKQQWNQMMNAMKTILYEHSEVSVWNELVISKPKNLEDVTQAVFYIDGSDHYHRARAEAHHLGKPLLTLRLGDMDEDLVFTCDTESNPHKDLQRGVRGR